MFSFDKHYTKWMANSLGVKTLPFEAITQDETKLDCNSLSIYRQTCTSWKLYWGEYCA